MKTRKCTLLNNLMSEQLMLLYFAHCNGCKREKKTMYYHAISYSICTSIYIYPTIIDMLVLPTVKNN